MAVRIEREGPVTTAILDRPERRNADDKASVAVLASAGGTFCAGADLKEAARGPAHASRIEPDGDGPPWDPHALICPNP